MVYHAHPAYRLSPPAVFFMGLFDGHDLQNPDKMLVIVYLVEDGKDPGDMNTIDAIIIREGEKFAAPGAGVFPECP